MRQGRTASAGVALGDAVAIVRADQGVGQLGLGVRRVRSGIQRLRVRKAGLRVWAVATRVGVDPGSLSVPFVSYERPRPVRRFVGDVLCSAARRVKLGETARNDSVRSSGSHSRRMRVLRRGRDSAC